MPKVLVVEDDRGVQDVVKIALECEGIDVEVAKGGEAALDRLDPSHSFDLVILDLMLPLPGTPRPQRGTDNYAHGP